VFSGCTHVKWQTYPNPQPETQGFGDAASQWGTWPKPRTTQWASRVWDLNLGPGSRVLRDQNCVILNLEIQFSLGKMTFVERSVVHRAVSLFELLGRNLQPSGTRHESRRCWRITYPESYFTKHTTNMKTTRNPKLLEETLFKIRCLR
jgi:hypothetical protein